MNGRCVVDGKVRVADVWPMCGRSVAGGMLGVAGELPMSGRRVVDDKRRHNLGRACATLEWLSTPLSVFGLYARGSMRLCYLVRHISTQGLSFYVNSICAL